jgi:hypothetical protein
MCALSSDAIGIRQDAAGHAAKPVIVSPSRPTDSRHEVVYAQQGKDEKDAPVVAGLLVQPETLKAPPPKFPRSLRGTGSILEVNVEGVVAPAGDFIDAKIKDAVSPDVEKSVLDAVSHYRFRPATLDGKPVAVLTAIVVHFQSCATKAECNTLRDQMSTHDKAAVPPTL